MNVPSLGKKISLQIAHMTCLQKKPFLIIAFLMMFLLVGTFLWTLQQNQSSDLLAMNDLTTEELRNLSSEYAIFGLSPEGDVGGRIVPASCEADPQDLHDAPSNYGQPCNSDQNACGLRNPGNIGCTGGCDATIPPNSLCVDVNIDALPNPIDLGDSTNLEWIVTNATQCSASGGWTGFPASSDGTHSQLISPNVTTTYFLSCSGPGGPVSDDVTVRLPDGGINATDCSIQANQSSCASIVNWSSQDFLGSPEVDQNGTVFSTLASHTGMSRNVSPGNATFRLSDTGGSFERFKTVNVGCVPGSTWVGGTCIVDPVITINPNYEDLIRRNDTADIEITVLANYTTECSMNDGTANPFTHSASASPTSYNITTRALASAQIVTFECHHATYPSVSASESVRIEVIPTVQEI